MEMGESEPNTTTNPAHLHLFLKEVHTHRERESASLSLSPARFNAPHAPVDERCSIPHHVAVPSSVWVVWNYKHFLSSVVSSREAVPAAHGVALQVAFERQTLKLFFPLIGYRLRG